MPSHTRAERQSTHNTHMVSSGVPGSGDGENSRREEGGAGKVMPGGKSQMASGGVNFDPTSAHFNPDPRAGIGVPAPHTTPSLNPPDNPISPNVKDNIRIPKVG